MTTVADFVLSPGILVCSGSGESRNHLREVVPELNCLSAIKRNPFKTKTNEVFVGAPHTVPDHPENLLYSGPVVLILFRQVRRYEWAMLLLKPLNIMPEKVEKHIYWTLVRIWPVLTEQRQGRNQG